MVILAREGGKEQWHVQHFPEVPGGRGATAPNVQLVKMKKKIKLSLKGRIKKAGDRMRQTRSNAHDTVQGGGKQEARTQMRTL